LDPNVSLQAGGKNGTDYKRWSIASDSDRSRSSILTVTILDLPLLLILCAASAAEPLTLVRQGRAEASVVLGSSPSEDDRFASAELVNYIRKSTGADLPIGGNAPVKIHLGLGACSPAVRKHVESLRGDGFLVAVRPNQIVLAGKGRHGTSFAVYEFLERFAGVRWLWPGELGEVVPQRTTLTVETVSYVREPAFLLRDLGPGGALWGAADRWTKERELGISAGHQAAQRLWERRNRFGGLSIYGGHAFGEILPPSKYGPVHPEYYALVNGKRDWENFNGKHRAQLCTSNPEVVKLVVAYVGRMFREHPDYDVVSISANDGRGFCECDSCQRLDTGDTFLDRADPETRRTRRSRVISDRMVQFGNEVAAGVAKNHPDKKIIFYAYSQYHQPPKKTKAHPNLIIQYTLNTSGLWNPKFRNQAFSELSGWANAAAQRAIYGYHTQGNFPDMFRLIPDLIALELRELRKLGYDYYQTQAGNGFAVNGLNFFVLGRLLWDPSTDPRLIIDDYVTAGFGRAAPAVKRYFNRHIAQWRSRQSSAVAMNDFLMADYRNVLEAYPLKYREACRQDLEEAARLAEAGVRGRIEFLREGFKFFSMTIEAAEKTVPLLRAGWKPAPGAGGREEVREAIQLWEERDRFIERHREDFVLSYLWVRYNDLMRRFNPLNRYRGAR
jgi:Domain of unknown function (DUF4838)